MRFLLSYKTILLITATIIWCHYIYYHFMFMYHCPEWPGKNSIQNYTRILVISDTHIMGSIKSFKIDKWIREWEMKQSYTISKSYYNPDLIIFLGDILDEGSISDDYKFDKEVEDFNRIFSIDKRQNSQKVLIIPGNHDIGFHNRMLYIPYLLDRFSSQFDATSNIELIDFNKLNIIVSNSMSFYDDNCPFCKQSLKDLNGISSILQQKKKESPNEFSQPILLTHVPLYRLNDINCDYPWKMRNIVKKDNIEGKDVLNKKVSQYIIQKLEPRLILSGHTHMSCETSHKLDSVNYKELTLTSFNRKYSQTTPEFLLISANTTHIYTKNCSLPSNETIMAIYIAVIIIICARFNNCLNINFFKKQKSNKNNLISNKLVE